MSFCKEFKGAYSFCFHFMQCSARAQPSGTWGGLWIMKEIINWSFAMHQHVCIQLEGEARETLAWHPQAGKTEKNEAGRVE